MHPDRIYLAPRGFEADLAEEIRRRGCSVVFQRERLLGVAGPRFDPVWAENVWLEPVFLPVRSIGNAAERLRGMGRNWALYSTAEHRRAALIQEALPRLPGRPFAFGSEPPAAPMGSWTLWDRDTLLASARCTSPFAHGAAPFAEDKNGPPNRAYLKLWEAFTRLGARPEPGDLCLDLGSSPGGWSWVLAGLGARVFSVDKAPLDAGVAGHPLVEHCSGSAFGLEPRMAGRVSWLFCDVACYPDRLVALVRRWLDEGEAPRMLCTMKFSGATDFEALEELLRIPGSAARHLFVNKHEITWALVPGGGFLW